MAGYPKSLFWVIEINLILWLALLGVVAAGKEWSLAAWLSVAGVVWAALMQHWGYHHIYKANHSSR